MRSIINIDLKVHAILKAKALNEGCTCHPGTWMKSCFTRYRVGWLRERDRGTDYAWRYGLIVIEAEKGVYMSSARFKSVRARVTYIYTRK